MKQQNIKFLLALLISMLGVKASAHDIAVMNADGKTINYYTYINNRTELAISYRGSSRDSYSNEYSGNVVIPKSVTYKGTTYSVTSIESYAFWGCTDLTSITIPNSVTRIGQSAFSGCSGLTSITVDNGNGKYDSRDNSNAIIETATNALIVGCKKTVIPNSVTSIGDFAFWGCSGLTSIIFPNSVTSIGDNAFSNCSGLTSITIPNSVTSIGLDAFAGTAWYNNHTDGVIYAGKVVYSYKGTMPSNTNIVLKEGTLEIVRSAFRECTGLTSITIPNSVTSIGVYAFEGCSSLSEVNFNATNCTTMGSGNYPVFSGCSSLTTVNIGDNVQNIPSYAFYGCSSLASITIPNSVTNIGERTFQGCSGLTSVTIGNSVTSIGNYAFLDCISLTEVNYNATNCTTMGSYGSQVFKGCSSLSTVNIGDNVQNIPSYAFYGCSSLTSVILSNSVTSIGERTFQGCSGLTSVTIGNSVASIGNYAFQDCIGLTEVHISDLGAWCNITFNNDFYANPLYYAKHLYLNGEEITKLNIPNSVTSIDNYAFNYCTGLTSITIPNSVTSIGNYAFQGCSGLKNVSIGNSVTSIGQNAFLGCDNLLTVNSEILEPFNCKDVFTTNTLRNGTLYIPAGTKDLYTRFDGWREFLKIEEVGGQQEQYVWLTIKDGRGSMMLKVKKGVTQELAVKPETGWKILMATMDGTDISAQIKNGNVYTTPAIMNDATINIIYEMDDPSGTVTARQSKADIKVFDDGIVISNAEPQSRCVVYSSSGQQVVNTVIEDGSRKIPLQNGQVYILTINGRTLKFAL